MATLANHLLLPLRLKLKTSSYPFMQDALTMTFSSRLGADTSATPAVQSPFVANASPPAQPVTPLVSWLKQSLESLNNHYTQSNQTFVCGVPYQPPQFPDYGRQQTFNAYHSFLEKQGKVAL
jgi:hypothetical protein